MISFHGDIFVAYPAESIHRPIRRQRSGLRDQPGLELHLEITFVWSHTVRSTLVYPDVCWFYGRAKLLAMGRVTAATSQNCLDTSLDKAEQPICPTTLRWFIPYSS
jgi:hypothetical protein